MTLVADESVDGRIIAGLRTAGLPIAARIEAVVAVLRDHADEIAGSFTVVSPAAARIRRSRPGGR